MGASPTPDSSSVPKALTNPMLGRAAAALALWEGGTQVYQRAKVLRDRYFTFRVTIEEGDAVYDDVHHWLLSILPEERHRSLRVITRRADGDDMMTAGSPYDPTGSGRPQRTLKVMFDDKSERKVDIDGHQIRVSLSTPEVAEKRNQYAPPKTIEFTARSYAGQQAVISHIRRIHLEQKGDRVPSLKMVSSWGQWQTRGDLPPRTLESVILAPGQKERVIDDLAAFLASEEEYNRLAIPWHRAYMFEGPPGTGKTSLIRAIAAHFNLDLWYIPLSDLPDEGSLLRLISEVGPRSMLLLEDIDTVRFTHDRDEEQPSVEISNKSVSLSSLLNALDGVATPHGLITMMTTNHFDRLDPALTRAGRMDVIEHIDRPGWGEVAGLYRHFYGLDLDVDGNRFAAQPLTAAEISEIFKRNLGEPQGASRALRAAIVRSGRVSA